jgi:hypothetical protein
MTIFYNPEKEISSGLHETVGPCDEMLPVNTAFGMVQILFLAEQRLLIAITYRCYKRENTCV